MSWVYCPGKWQVISLPLAIKCKLLAPLTLNSRKLVENINSISPFPILAIIIADVMCVALASHLIAIGNKVQAVNATPCELFKNAPCLKD